MTATTNNVLSAPAHTPMLNGARCAEPQDWDVLVQLGLTEHLLPIVGDLRLLDAVPEQARCKAPSVRVGAASAALLKGWQNRQTTVSDIREWSADPCYNIGVRAALLPAIDVDIDAPQEAALAWSVIARHLPDAQRRVRANSARFLVPVYIDTSDLRKQVLKTPQGKIELLAQGQQFVAFGMHPSGARYSWEGDLGLDFYRMSAEEFKALWSDLANAFNAQAQLAQNAATTLQSGTSDVPKASGAPQTHPRIGMTLRHCAEALEALVERQTPTDYSFRLNVANAIFTEVAPATDEDNNRAFKLFEAWCEACPEYAHASNKARDLWPGFNAGKELRTPVTGAWLKAQALRAKEQIAVNLSTNAFDALGDPPPRFVVAETLSQNYAAARGKFTKPAPRVPLTQQCPTGASGFSLSGVDYRTPLTDSTLKGAPKPTLANFAEILNRTGIVIRYNVIKKKDEMLIPGMQFSIDNAENAAFAVLQSECAKFDLRADGKLHSFAIAVADRNQYNPVATWVKSAPWDGQDRLQALYDTVQAKEEQTDPEVKTRKELLMKRWLISAVAAAFEPNGVALRGVLVFQGPQYIGKTRWLKSLAPRELDVIQDGVILDLQSKDSIMIAMSHWIIEMGELDATFRKSDQSKLKAFLNQQFDILRRPYAPKDSKYPRRTVFFASVNTSRFLHDETGNSRYWTVECEFVNADHGIDMQQLWRQVYEQFYLASEQWHLTNEENRMLAKANEAHEAYDPIAELLDSKLDWDSDKSTWLWKRTVEVAVDIGIDPKSRGDTTRLGICLEKKMLDSKHGKSHKLRLVPPPKTGWALVSATAQTSLQEAT